VTLVNTRSGPTIGLRGVVVAASSDSFGTATALSLALNAFRLQIAWFRNADSLTVETASKVAAWRAYWEGQDPARNFDYQAFENLRGPYSTTDRISVVEANNALNSGLTPIGINRAGKAFMWRSITSRFQDTNGGPDYRVLDTSKVAVVDYIADFLASDYLVKGYQSMKLRDDSGDQRPQTGVITPKIIRSWIVGVLKGAENNDPILLENVDAHLNELEVKLSTVVPGRMEARIPLDVIEGFHQLDMTLLQIG
jgi:phage tail sheath gpL-like